jgi:glycosyltransferase involved in cell wall biosynthesis
LKIEDLAEKWTGFDLATLKKVVAAKTPLVTMATLSLFRYELLFKQLENTNNVIKTPLYTCLRVQAAERMPQAFKIKLIQMLEKYYMAYDLQFTFKNHGSGVPRNDVVTRARTHFGTPYIMTLDDDIILPPFAVEALVSILETKQQLGAVALSCHPKSMTAILEGDRLKNRPPPQLFGRVDGVGSATMMIRKRVFDTCDLDKQYYIGWGDMDFCMQMKKAGWKIGYLNIPNYIAMNPQQPNPTYKKIRFNKDHANRSWDRFFKKWNVKIGG